MILGFNSQTRENASLCGNGSMRENAAVCGKGLKVTKRKDECVYYTGFSKGKFTSILSFLVPDNKTCPFSTKKNLKCFKSLSLEDQLLLVLVKLRQNFDFVHLSKLLVPYRCSHRRGL